MAVVLVVDDHISITEAVAAMARGSHCEVAVAHTGKTALDYVRAHPVDVVVLDAAMPGMSGLDVLRELAADGRLPDLPVLMFSASEDYRDAARRLGAAWFILKHEPDDLPALIERYAFRKNRAAGLHA